MRIFLEPSESLIFRTGRPFDAGEVGYAETIFPPTPETFQGAIRALIATHWNPNQSLSQVFAKGSDLVKLIGDRDTYGHFRIRGISLGRRKNESLQSDQEDSIELLYPAPAHLLKNESSFFRLLPNNVEDVVSSNIPQGMKLLYPDPRPPDQAEGKLEPVDGWLNEADLRTVLNAEADLSKLEIISKREILEYEPRLGIGIENASKTTQDGMLYSMQMIRMQPKYGFVVDITLTDEENKETFVSDDKVQCKLKLPEQGWTTIGGEQRATRFTVISASLSRQDTVSQHKGHGTLLYLATPAAFKDGWRPKQRPTNLPAPIAAAIQRYQPIGGWKLNPENSGGSNKCMRRCVPAGSVYFFDGFPDIPCTFTEYGTEIGYGITVKGEW